MWRTPVSSAAAWLQDGAHVHVCGDADRMAKDADAMLHDIARCGPWTPTPRTPTSTISSRATRYLRDVYTLPLRPWRSLLYF